MTASFRLIVLSLLALALASAYSSARADTPHTGALHAGAPPAPAAPAEPKKPGDKPPVVPAPAPTLPAPPVPPPAPPAPPAAPAPTPPAPGAKAPQQLPSKAKNATTCKVVTEEAPRGGRLDVSGSGFGQTPIVRIADKVTRILSRTADTISVQIARDSDGGPVTVEASGVRTACGWLTIIGKDR